MKTSERRLKIDVPVIWSLSTSREMYHIRRIQNDLNHDIFKTSCAHWVIKNCIKENLIPKYLKLKSNIINENGSLKKKVTRLILSTELSNKHREKKETREEILKLQSVLQYTLSYTLYCAIMYRFSNSYWTVQKAKQSDQTNWTKTSKSTTKNQTKSTW